MTQEHPLPTLNIKTYKSGKHAIRMIEGRLQLTSWAGFQNRQGWYNGKDREAPSDGWVKLSVDGDNSTDTPSLTPEQAAAYHYLLEHQETIKNSILNALLPQYMEWREEYGYEGEEEEQWMPAITDTATFQRLMGLGQVHLLEQSKEGIAYVGYEFGCEWDPEHGLGILTHRDRVLEIGGADVSFNTWTAENDIDPVAAQKELEKYKDMRGTPPPVKKPWWKFW